MLPLSMAWALMVGIWTSVSHIIIISVYVPVTRPKTPDLVVQVRIKCIQINISTCVMKFFASVSIHAKYDTTGRVGYALTGSLVLFKRTKKKEFQKREPLKLTNFYFFFIKKFQLFPIGHNHSLVLVVKQIDSYNKTSNVNIGGNLQMLYHHM